MPVPEVALMVETSHPQVIGLVQVIWGFPKCCYPTNPWIFLLKMISTWGVKWGETHHFEETPILGKYFLYLQGFIHVRWCLWPILGGSSHHGRKWLITMVIVSPRSRDMGPLPNGLFMAYKWGLLTSY